MPYITVIWTKLDPLGTTFSVILLLLADESQIRESMLIGSVTVRNMRLYYVTSVFCQSEVKSQFQWYIEPESPRFLSDFMFVTYSILKVCWSAPFVCYFPESAIPESMLIGSVCLFVCLFLCARSSVHNSILISFTKIIAHQNLWLQN